MTLGLGALAFFGSFFAFSALGDYEEVHSLGFASLVLIR
jgi:hypothetical protein